MEADVKPYWNLNEFDNDKFKWEDVFQDDKLVSTTSTGIVLFDGVKITSDTKDLNLDHVILVYIPNMLSKDIYKSTLRLANVYYEGAPLYGNKSQKKGKNSQRGFYKNISHGYSSNGGINCEGNIVPYHSKKISLDQKQAFKDIGDEIASNIWKSAMPTFGQKIDHHFRQQSSTTNHIYVGLDESPTNVCQLHFSKNSFIKPHVDSLDMESSIITWFTSGAPLKGQFALHQYMYKFQTSNGPGLFVKSEEYVHGTLHFDTRGNTLENYTLGLALTNKKWLKTRVEHQMTAQTHKLSGIPSKKYWYSLTPEDSHEE